MNQFREKILREFEQDLYRCLNITLDDFVRIVGRGKTDPIEEFDQILETKGVQEVRIEMQHKINCLSVVYKERELGRKMNEKEFVDNAKELGLSALFD